MAAAVQHNRFGIADLIGQFLCNARWSNRVFVAGDDKSGAIDQPVIGFVRLRERFTGTGKAFGVLAHMALADERHRKRIIGRGRG